MKVAGNARMVRPVYSRAPPYERLPEVGKDMEDPLVNLAAIVGWLVLIISSIPVALLVFTKRPKGDRPR